MKYLSRSKKIKFNITRKKMKNKNKIIKLRCSPREKNKMNDFSCYTDESLYKLRNLWNKKHPDELIQSNEPREIWNKLNEYMKHLCNKESCWLKQNFTIGKVDNELSDSFAPESPEEWKSNPNEWLSSIDIIKVMKQYEKAYKCFEFIGPSPIDYDKKKLYGECVWDELCHFNLGEQMKKGKTKIGIIFNLDPHYKSGSHWVSLFINLKKKQIFYFDSNGDTIPDQIMKFVVKISDQGRNLRPKVLCEFDQNHPIEHQYGETECGVYSIFFIVHMLEDKITNHYLKTHVLKDEYMHKFRKVFFNENL
jgi:hypothetical protein